MRNWRIYYGLPLEEVDQIRQYSTIHLGTMKWKTLSIIYSNEQQYEALNESTLLGTKIAKRLQLAQKAEDISRAHVEGVADQAFVKRMNLIQPSVQSQVILLCDLYVTMRSSKSYKRPYPNHAVISLFEKSFLHYFEYSLVERFLKFKSEFEKIFNDY